MTERLIVVGGGAGGPSAAAKAKREKPSLDVHIFERGPHVSYAACPTPYYIGGRIADADAMIARTPERFARDGIEVHLGHEVTAIDPEAGTATDADGTHWAYDYLVYAAGAHSHRPPIPGLDSPHVYTLKDLRDAQRIKQRLDARPVRRALVMGAGYIALEMAEALRERGVQTTILHGGERPLRLLAPELSALLAAELERNGVRYVPGVVFQGVAADEQEASVATDGETYAGDIVIAALGVRPTVDLARATGIALGETGAVVTNDHQETNLERIYAAGDCTEVRHRVSDCPAYLPLGDIANKQGRVAGANIGGGEVRFPGALGSQSVKLFDLEVALTGLNDEQAARAGFSPVAAQVTARSRAGAYPGGQPLHVRLLAEKTSGRLLGAQLVGAEGAVGRTNVVAAALDRCMSVIELMALDLCYAPPYSPVWDPLHIAAQACAKRL